MDDSAFPRHFEFDELPSTNDHALELLARSEAALPFVVSARRQTAGRGRGTNRWWSAAGALTFSVAVDPASYGWRSDQFPQVALASAVALCRTVDAVRPKSLEIDPATVKWPNDVWWRGRKLAGILVEQAAPICGVSGARRGPPLVVGVGVNVNNLWSETCESKAGGEPAPGCCPPRFEGISIREIVRSEVPIEQFFQNLLAALDQTWRELSQRDGVLPREWQQRSALTGRHVRVSQPPQEWSGLCRGIGPAGELRVWGRASDDESTPLAEHRVFSGTVSLVEAPAFDPSSHS